MVSMQQVGLLNVGLWRDGTSTAGEGKNNFRIFMGLFSFIVNVNSEDQLSACANVPKMSRAGS